MTADNTSATPEELSLATQITVETLATVLKDSEATPETLLRHLGDFMICCAIAGVNPSDESARERLIEGLANSGVDMGVSEEVSDRTRKLDTRRMVFSLSYIPFTEQVPGIKTVRTGRTIDEKEFVLGIISKNQHPQMGQD